MFHDSSSFVTTQFRHESVALVSSLFSCRYMVASQLQAIAARSVFPCFDEPDMKANFTVSITHQAGLTEPPLPPCCLVLQPRHPTRVVVCRVQIAVEHASLEVGQSVWRVVGERLLPADPSHAHLPPRIRRRQPRFQLKGHRT